MLKKDFLNQVLFFVFIEVIKRIICVQSGSHIAGMITFMMILIPNHTTAQTGNMHEDNERLPAFPGAEGFGRYAEGGRGGDVYYVTNLNDSGPGSLRYGIMSADGPRTILFGISGNIWLESPLVVDKPYITIAGQTAPGDGITLQNMELKPMSDHLIIRYIRSRLGDQGGLDFGDQGAISITHGSNIIVDHCSASWSIDETFSAQSETVDSLTIQWCFITEALDRSIHSEGAHSKGGIAGALRMSYHHNLWAHHVERNPNVSRRRDLIEIDYRNNVIYNWKERSNHGGSTARANWVNNYYKPGPATRSENRNLVFEIDKKIISAEPEFYIEGNFMDGDPEVTADNWEGVQYRFGAGPHNRVYEPFPYPIISYETTPQEAYEAVLTSAGASIARDTIDLRIVEDVRTGTAPFGRNGIIDSQVEIGGWPELKSVSIPLWVDTNRNGIPDWWAVEQGLDPQDPDLANKDSNGNGYTNLEDYINDLDAVKKTHVMAEEADEEVCFVAGPHVVHVDSGSAQLVWVTPQGTLAGQVNLQAVEGGEQQSMTAQLMTPGFQRGVNVLTHLQQRVSIEGLESYTRYEYSVECGDASSTHSGSFMTAPEPGEAPKIEFVVVADGHAVGGMYASVAEAVGDKQPDFVIHAGGMIGGEGSEWDKWLHYSRVARPFLDTSVLWPVAGKDNSQPARNLRALFGFNNPEGEDLTLEDNAATWYSFSYGNMQFFVFDYSRDLSSQLEWAEQELGASQAEWKIVTYHHPNPGVGGSGSVFEIGNEEFVHFKRPFAQLFEEHGVDVVIHGGNYIFERKLPIGSQGVNPVHYLAINSGGSFRAVRPSPIVSGGIGLQERMFAHFNVEGNRLEMEALRDDGTLIDRLDLIKGEDGLYQQEIMEQAIDMDLALQLSHIYTGQSMLEDLRYERRDLPGEFISTIPPVAGETTEVMLYTGYTSTESNLDLISRFPIGSELVVHEQEDPSGWRTENQVIEITGEWAELEVMAPAEMSIVDGRTNPSLELQAHLRMDGHDFDPVTIRPTMSNFESLGQVALMHPVNLSKDVEMQPIFHWEALSHATEYQFQITETGFYDIMLDTNITDNQIQLSYDLKADQNHRWRIRGINVYGEGPWSKEWLFITKLLTSTTNGEGVPDVFELGQNYPNPFNPSTMILYSLPVHAHVSLRVYDVIGREVAVLINEEQQGGYHRVTFDFSNFSSGMYLYRLEANVIGSAENERFVQTRRMTLIK